MTITTTPSKFHAAFNPIIFEVTKSSDTETSASLSIYNENGTLVATLTRAFYGTKTRFDVSGVVCKMFSGTEPIFYSGVAVDKRLFVKYKVGGDYYFAVNAAVSLGNTPSLNGQIGVILSRLSKAIVFAGYPFDISVLVNTSFSGLTAESINRVQDAASFIENMDADVYLVDNSENYIVDELLNYVVLQRSGTSVGGFDYQTEKGCIPVNPFYVRWINDVGGIDYWMFSVYQELKTSLKSSSTYRKFYTDSEAEKGSEVVYAQESEDTIMVGSDDLTEEQYNALSLIPFSPMIEWYNKDAERWIRLTVDKEDNTLKSSQTIQEISISFTLPKRNLQF